LKLRSDVFVVEQACPYPELDGRDAEAGTEHRWLEDDAGELVAYVRTLAEPDGTTRLGRVVTRPDARRGGLAKRLVEGVLADHDDVRADAQAHLAGWYEALGFEPTGPEYLEDGIPHVPMRRPNSTH
jgi:ElaA protein